MRPYTIHTPIPSHFVPKRYTSDVFFILRIMRFSRARLSWISEDCCKIGGNLRGFFHPVAICRNGVLMNASLARQIRFGSIDPVWLVRFGLVPQIRLDPVQLVKFSSDSSDPVWMAISGLAHQIRFNLPGPVTSGSARLKPSCIPGRKSTSVPSVLCSGPINLFIFSMGPTLQCLYAMFPWQLDVFPSNCRTCRRLP